MQGGVNTPHVLRTETEAGCVASFRGSVFHWDLIFLISWGDNGPLGEWSFPCPFWLCPSLEMPLPIQVTQDFSAGLGQQSL